MPNESGVRSGNRTRAAKKINYLCPPKSGTQEFLKNE